MARTPATHAIAALLCSLAGCAQSVDPAPIATETAGLAPAGEPACSPPACDPVCVEGGRYEASATLVTDGAQGGRVWQRRVSAQLTWDEAAAYCAGLTLEGAGGFRLPTQDELSTLRYRAGGLFGGMGAEHYCVPALDQAAFPDAPADQTWSSDREADDTAWYIDFADGRAHREVRSAALWVRCVRDASAQ